MSQERCQLFISIILITVLQTVLSISAAAQAEPTGSGQHSANPFPVVDPQSVGLSAVALARLSDHVQNLVDADEIVGGELHVIKNRRTVLHRAYGWHDRKTDKSLAVNSIYCVRSMTKPLVGTAIQMLIDDGRLQLDTRVGAILPAFDTPRLSEITVAHLLTHTSGLPFSTIKRPLPAYSDLSEIVAEAATAELAFKPGTDFTYSDAGSDTLGAIIAVLTDGPVEDFIKRRILDPLGMDNTLTLLGDKEASPVDVPSAYSGGTGAWSRHWQSTDPPIFPFFLTSQSLYATTTDYARFLAMWMDGGRAGEPRLLSEQAVARALAPTSPMDGYTAGFDELSAFYAQQWMVYAAQNNTNSSAPIAFGHSGSDGTHAWAWPEEDLMVLFFTQSRGATAGVGLERQIHKLLFAKDLVKDEGQASNVAKPKLEGLYWDETNAAAYYRIKRHGDRLILERPGQARLVFLPSETPGRFVHEVNAQAWIEFVVEDGRDVASALRTSFGGQVEVGPRYVPNKDLPSVDEVVAMVQGAHHLDRLADLGVVELTGKVKIEANQREGDMRLLFDVDRSRSAIDLGSMREVGVVEDGRAWSYATNTGLQELDGVRHEQAVLDRFAVTFGDWRDHYAHVEVMKRVQAGDESALLVRVVPRKAPGATIFVHEPSGRVVMIHGLVQVPGVGIIGLRTRFRDFRDVGGMLLPFQVVADYAIPQIGRVISQMESAKVGLKCKKKQLRRLPGRSGCNE